MTRWWASNGPRSAPMPPAERAAQLLESLLEVEHDKTDELLSVLALCTPTEWQQLFGSPSRAPAPAPAAKPSEPAAERHAAQPDKSRDPHAGWRWDERGYRISPKGESAFEFTRNYEQPPSRRTHWSD
jgi:hypothetical protein